MKNNRDMQISIPGQEVVHSGPPLQPSTQGEVSYSTLTYPLEDNVNRHVVFNKDGHLVFVDTGATVSFGRQEDWEFMGRPYHLPLGFPKLNPDSLSQNIGARIDCLLGMNIMKDYCFKVNFQDRTITFSERLTPAGCKRMDIDLLHGCLPYASFMVNGSPQTIHIDTGAKINFLRKEALKGLDPVDTEMDFHPLFGDFRTDIYQVPVEIAGDIHLMRCGVLTPELVEYLDKTGGFKGALGTELYDIYIATFDIRNKVLFLKRWN